MKKLASLSRRVQRSGKTFAASPGFFMHPSQHFSPVACLLLFLLLFIITPCFAEEQSSDELRMLEAERLEIFDEINQLRSRYSRETLIIDANLTAAAQRQADYLASIGKLVREGPAHESLRIQAEDSGYGGGQNFSIAEALACVWVDTDAEYLVNEIWKAEQSSLQAVMGPDARHIGIGIADTNTKRRFVVAIFGGLEDGKDTYTVQSTYDFRTPKPLLSSTPTLAPNFTSTPHEDGGIYHIVREGETFSDVALAYGMDWYTLGVLNHINIQTAVVIYEGEQLVIRPTFTLTPTPTASRTPRPDTSTPRPTFTTDPDWVSQNTEAELNPAEAAPVEKYAALLQRLSSWKAVVGTVLVVVCVLGLAIIIIRMKNE